MATNARIEADEKHTRKGDTRNRRYALHEIMKIPGLNSHVMRFLESKDMVQVMRVDKRWYKAAQDPLVWSSLCITQPEDCDLESHPFSRYQKLRVLTTSKKGISLFLRDELLIKLVQHCPNLQTLDVAWYGNIADASILSAAQHCPNLQSLDISWCKQITDKSILAVTQNCCNLQSLNVRNCWNLTEKSIFSLVQNCRNLQYLDVKFCHQLTDKSVLSLTQNCPHVRLTL